MFTTIFLAVSLFMHIERQGNYQPLPKRTNSHVQSIVTLTSSKLKTPTILPTSAPLLTLTVTPTPTTIALVKSEEIIPTTQLPEVTYEAYFDQFSNQFGADKNLLKKIAICESSINPNAKNGLYGGIFQFAAQTWVTTRSDMKLDTNPDLRFNAEESIKTAAFKVGRDGTGAWAGCL